ncbi:MAG: hypothetical protein U5L95_02445 [Candidatus Saccharibacteria bacterium]|nr:hypothetical protein [Candidatus Saccharibacteria bacterium]
MSRHNEFPNWGEFAAPEEIGVIQARVDGLKAGLKAGGLPGIEVSFIDDPDAAGAMHANIARTLGNNYSPKGWASTAHEKVSAGEVYVNFTGTPAAMSAYREAEKSEQDI